ncbi:hypothetical protein GYMLUDRAFT_246552 [Collybiopsis luxurians FD-317 M1]|uniref:Uncharacterized protein n=1 Tax=Collybiopsis luxurians FD-317 M1 TaxID=944289 RepID=A0A0D0CQW7_9AGAR|nr:hypothetical protein GYMLUDRAFT_246552 [Collybiopsis luxurians FD-317 M1]
MSALQSFPDQPAASSSNSGGSRPRIIFKFPQAVQPVSAIPLSTSLPSVPPAAKKMRHVAFERSLLLEYPSVLVSASTPSSLPSNVQSIYDDTYLANSSLEVLEQVPDDEWCKIFALYPSCEYCASHNLQSSCSLHSNSLSCATCKMNYLTSKKFCSFKSIFQLLQFHVLAKLPLVVAYCFVSSCRNFVIWDKEWAALTTGLHDYPYYREHLEELGLASEKLRAQEGKRKAVVSSNAFRKSQLLRQERVHLGEPSRKQVVLALSHKGKEVVCDPVNVNVKMEAPDTMDSMDLDYPEEVPPTSAPIPAAPASAPMKSTVIWKVNNRWSYREVSGVKTWFFEPQVVKPVPSDSSIPSRDEMIQTAIEHVVTWIAELLSGLGKKMIEQDLWALADGMIQGVFNELEEQLNHPSSEPPTPFSNYRLTQFVESLSMINLSSASIVDAQQDELLRVYREYHTLLQKSDGLETENLHLKEQGDAQSTLRGAMESWDSEIEELKKKLAASEEAHQVTAEESKSRDEELAQLQQLFESV